jgi:aspartate aminotransferase
MSEVTTTPRTPLRTSRRMEAIGFSEIAAVREVITAMRQQGHEVFELHGGEPFFTTPQPIKDAMTQALVENHTRYPLVNGVAPLRERIAEKLRQRNAMSVGPEQIQVTNGGIHALYCAFQAVLEPGDELLVFSPYWTPIRDLVKLAGAVPAPVHTHGARERGVKAALEAATTPRTRAIYFNSPQNPAGTVFTPAEMNEVAEFAQERDLVVISDEAYEDIIYGTQHISMGALPGMLERTIVCFTFSKSYSMTGWRVGYAVVPEPWIAAMRKLALYTTSGVNQPAQWAALSALELPYSDLQKRCAEFQRRRDLLVNGLRSVGFAIEPPAGAFYAFPDVTHLARSSEAAAKLLLERARVSCVSGAVFGDDGEGHVRMTFSVTPETIQGAIDSMRRNL